MALTLHQLLDVPGVIANGGELPFGEFDCALRLTVQERYEALDLLRSTVQIAEYPKMSASGPLQIRGDAIYVDALELVGGTTRVHVAGVFDGRRGANRRVELDPLDLDDVVEATGWELIEAGGTVRGVTEVEGDWTDLELRLDLNAALGGDRRQHPL